MTHLVHTSISEEQSWVLVRDSGRGGDIGVVL